MPKCAICGDKYYPETRGDAPEPFEPCPCGECANVPATLRGLWDWNGWRALVKFCRWHLASKCFDIGTWLMDDK